MPGLWLFLLIVVAVLLFVVGLTSLLMHLLQYRYRQNLRRRVANGEVDLEALGVKRLTVPKEILDKFPITVYVAHPPVPSQPNVSDPSSEVNSNNDPSAPTEQANAIGVAHASRGEGGQNRQFYQPSCPVSVSNLLYTAHYLHRSSTDMP